MRTLRLAILGILALVSLGAWAQQDIAGIWAGKLAIAPGQELAVQFVLTRKQDGGYTAVLTSPSSGAIKDVRVDTVTFAGDKLAMTVSALSGSYEGALKNGAFTGKWKQEGNELPLELKPYTTPVLTQADKDRLRGSWLGKLTSPAGELTIVFRFENNAASEFVALLDSPDQGANGIATTNLALADGTLSFRVPRIQGEYSGKLEGDKLTGTWSQLGQGVPLSLTKGTYTPKLTNLSLSKEAMATLAGTWQGKLGPLTIVLRFESPGPGQSAAYIDVPEQGAKGLPVAAATFADNKLTVKIDAVRAEYTATLSSTTLTGEWSQLGMKNPLTLTKSQ